MLPTKSNHTKDGCVTTSSNCVIWQGPDLGCIHLCTGDTVSDVIAKLATDLCDILDQTSITSFDIACLGAAPAPTNFNALVQLIIDRICALEEGTGGGGGGIIVPGGCPDCPVALPECLQYTNPATGSLVTQLNLNQYAAFLAGEICKIIADIDTLQETVLQNSTDITNLEDRVTVLEVDAERDLVLPNVNISCITGVTQTPLNTAVVRIADELCGLENILGNNSDLAASILTQCNGLNTSPVLSGTGLMNNIPGWVPTVQNVAESINNLWLTICDMRSAIQTIQLNCCPTLCSTINVALTITVDTQINFAFTGTIPTEFFECNPLGTSFTIVGDGYSGVVPPFLVKPRIGGTYSINIPPGLNVNADFSVTANLCLQNSEGSECQSVLAYNYTSIISCPTVTIVPSVTSLVWSFLNATSAPIYYKAELFNSAGTTVVSSTTISNPAIGTVTQTISGLSASTSYKLRISYSIDNRTFTQCPFSSIVTLSPGCTEIETESITTEITFTPNT
jgi:hypothetical protein